MSISITDIYGNDVTSDTKIIVITSSDIHLFLNKLVSLNKTIILSYNNNKINELLKKHNIDFSQYVFLGHVLYTEENRPTNIILANKSICVHPNNMKTVISYKNGKIVCPQYIQNNKSNNPEYTNYGLFYFHDDKNMNINRIGVIKSEYILSKKKSKDVIKPVQNEYNILSHESIGVKLINKNKLNNYDLQKIKLESSSYKYLLSDNDPNIYLQNQHISHDMHDELNSNSYDIMNEKTTIDSDLILVDTENPWFDDKYDTLPYNFNIISDNDGNNSDNKNDNNNKIKYNLSKYNITIIVCILLFLLYYKSLLFNN
jgi:hypothetical protein